jgi:hypothetical protein
MTKLYELTSLIRSKNAGPYTLTMDIIFHDEAGYRRVVESGVLGEATFERLYGIAPGSVEIYEYEPAFAIKATMPRASIAGDLTDGDVSGAQQHGPIVDLDVPD